MKLTVNKTTINNVTGVTERFDGKSMFMTTSFTDTISLVDMERLFTAVISMSLEKTNSEGELVSEDLSQYKTLISINKTINDNQEDAVTIQMRA